MLDICRSNQNDWDWKAPCQHFALYLAILIQRPSLNRNKCFLMSQATFRISGEMPLIEGGAKFQIHTSGNIARYSSLYDSIIDCRHRTSYKLSTTRKEAMI